ncbi:MAG: GNAT family N-acetyltransferase [Candidatus Eisenbacteria bacterium]|nr:GNAT family N-acetyltransferase [Candidatus Eisenbacteria bacterium]
MPDWIDRDRLVRFFHDHMKPYEDRIEDIRDALDYAFSESDRAGGFLVLAETGGELVGALLMLRTGMSGYVPDHILLFVGVRSDLRGRGLGGRIVRRALEECDGDVKLHVEYDNPAKRLYKRLGFTSKYAEMRITR